VIGDLFAFLVDAMIDRETKKFGDDIENATTKHQRLTFIRRLMEEVARDQAENQSDAIPLETIVWLSEMVAHDLVPENLVGILKNRAGVIAFLIDDDRRGYRRFAHEQVSNYFLSFVTIRAIVDGEIPKYVRRNIFGLDLLENFCSVFREMPEDISKNFIETTNRQIKLLGDGDRAKRNLGALLIAACSVSEPTEVPVIENLSLDDVYISESIYKIKLLHVTVGQLFAREADLRQLLMREPFLQSPSPFQTVSICPTLRWSLLMPKSNGFNVDLSRPKKICLSFPTLANFLIDLVCSISFFASRASNHIGLKMEKIK